jgi:SAM-dependent methyltransferase
MTGIIEPAVAEEWLRRWDRQQERYISDREERFTVIGDVVAHAVGQRSHPTVLDLGCGPGSLAARLAARLPSASIIGIDSDPVLLALARGTAPDTVRFVDADLTDPAWTGTAGLTAPIDAAVSTTALHWLSEPALARVYREIADLLLPGGVLVNGDHFLDEQPTLARLTELVRTNRAARRGVTGNEEWAAWWSAAEADRDLAPLVAQRRRRGVGDHGMGTSLQGHVNLLRRAGFREVGTVWEFGDDRVLVAVR